MALETVAEAEAILDRGMLNELVHWIKALNGAGVSPDVAAQVTKDLLIAVCAAASDDELELDYDDED